MRVVASSLLCGLTLLASSAALAVPLGVPLTARGYERLGESHGVTVYKHKKSGALAAEGLFAGDPAAVQKALLAYDRHATFNKHIKYSRVLARGKRWLLVYQELKLPVISNRDFTLYVSWGRRKQGRWVQFWTANERGPKRRKGIVRVRRHRGGWQLEPRSAGRTFARYEADIDLGGWVPGWLARSGTKRELPKLFVGLRQMVETPPGSRAAAR